MNEPWNSEAMSVITQAVINAVADGDVLQEVAAMIGEEDEPLRSRLLAGLREGKAERQIADAVAVVLKEWASEMALSQPALAVVK